MSAQASPTYDEIRDALLQSHDRLVATVATLSDPQLSEPSYDDDWTIAQVLSHLGAGAEVFTLFLEAGLQGEPAPAPEAMQPVWESWNAKTPRDQAQDSLAANAAFLDRIADLSDADKEGWRLALFGDDQDLPALLRMRLSEHAVHSWDVLVALDSSASVDANAVALLIDTLPRLVSMVAKPDELIRRIQVRTQAPDREFLLDLKPDSSRLTATSAPAGSTDDELRLPAEAFLRLVYGRLDPEHTPPEVAGNAHLDVLRPVFPGL
ncbi:MAG: hypothetical protein QOH80_680 [Actinomycetota bacterium]|nr:hypothetical protein [Actinomycetota bacterium]